MFVGPAVCNVNVQLHNDTGYICRAIKSFYFKNLFEANLIKMQEYGFVLTHVSVFAAERASA